MSRVAIYRIVGSELPPRDIAGTRERATEYILQNERLPSNVTVYWIMNQVGPPALRRRLHDLFTRYKANVIDFPLSHEAVINAPTFAEKVRWAIDINSRRNYAVDNGQARKFDWTVVLDGDCMFTASGFEDFHNAAVHTSHHYVGVPSRRCVVYGDGTREPVGDFGEPMLAFSGTASRRFDEALPFGQGDKLRLLISLGFLPDEGRHTERTPQAIADVGGWVEHISLDVANDAVERSRQVREATRMAGLRAHIDWIQEPQPRNLYSPFNQGWKTIDGFFDFDGPYSGIAADVPDGYPLVEVGSWLGKSAIYLARELELRGKTNKLFCVDTWNGEPDLQQRVKQHGGQSGMFEQFIYNTRHHRGRIIPIPMASTEAAKLFKSQSLMMVFIDANHSYEAVLQDLQAWWPKICPGGMICGHDYVPTHPNSINGVVKAVDEFFTHQGVETRPYSRVWKCVKRKGPRLWS